MKIPSPLKKTALVAVTAVAALFASGAALAQWHHHGRVGIGIQFGAPWPGYYYPPAYYYPPVVAVPAQPPVYIEQPQVYSPPAAVVQGDWYYCGDSRAYYPYVRDCPGGWQRVPSQPR